MPKDAAQQFVDETYKIRISRMMEDFRDSDESSLVFPNTLSNAERKYVHQLVPKLGLKSKSRGKGERRFLTISKKVEGVSILEGCSAPTLVIGRSSEAVLCAYFASHPVTSSERAELVRTEAELRVLRTRRAQEVGVVRKVDDPKAAFLSSGAAMFSAAGALPACAAQLLVAKPDTAEERKMLPPVSEARSRLPTFGFRSAITRCISKTEVTIISGETGCGKSTQVPQYLLDDPSLNSGAHIVCTQPRRLSARALADRVAEERNEAVGGTVGFAVRLESKRSASTRLLFCTTGILLRSVTVDSDGDSMLDRATHLIIDEVHERDRNADFLLILVRELLAQRRARGIEQSLRLILMSATLQVDRFRAYFEAEGLSCCHVHAKGSLFSVKRLFLEDVLARSSLAEELDAVEAQLEAMSSSVPEEAQGAVLATPEFKCRLCGATGFQSPQDFGAHAATCTGTSDNIVAHSAEGGSVFADEGFGAEENGCSVELEISSDGGGQGDTDVVCGVKCDFVLPSTAFEVPSSLSSGNRSHCGVDECTESARNAALLRTYQHARQSKDDELEVDVDLVVSLLEYIDANPQADIGEGRDHPAIQRRATTPIGAVLVFLPGWGDITRLVDALEAHPVFGNSRRFLVLPLHSGVPTSQQRLVFRPAPQGCRKIVCSTNIAETSVTIEDVTHVIDTGLVKKKTYDPMTKVCSLAPQWIAKDSCAQRCGRAGRCRRGVRYALYSRERFKAMAEEALPEMQRTPLEELCLQSCLMTRASSERSGRRGKKRSALHTALHGMTIADFLGRALSPPKPKAITNAVELLRNLGALGGKDGETPTPLGLELVRLPVDPRVGKMVLYGALLNCLTPSVVLSCATTYREPFCLPMLAQQKNLAETAKRRLADGSQSDHVALLRANEAWINVRGSHSKERELCDRLFLSSNVMRTVDQMCRQILGQLRQRGLVSSNGSSGQRSSVPRALDVNATNAGVVQALVCAGTFPNVALLRPGTRNFVSGKENRIKPHISSIHRRSFVCGRNKDAQASFAGEEYQWFVFDELSRGKSGCTMRCCSHIRPLILALFCGHTHAEKGDPCRYSVELNATSPADGNDEVSELCTNDVATMHVSDWIRLLAPSDLAIRIGVLRLRLERAFARRVSAPRSVLPSGDQEVVSAVVRLLTAEVGGVLSAGLEGSEARQRRRRRRRKPQQRHDE